MKVLRLSEREGGQTGRRLEPVKGGKMVWTPREEIVRGLLVKRARPTSLYALPGVGKGNVAIYIQLSIRHGLPVFGFEARSVDWFGYVDGEDDRAEFERRASRIAKGLAIELDDTLNYVEVPFKLNTAKSRREIEDVLCEWSKQGNGLVVYDSAQALFGGNQASGEMGDAVYPRSNPGGSASTTHQSSSTTHPRAVRARAARSPNMAPFISGPASVPPSTCARWRRSTPAPRSSTSTTRSRIRPLWTRRGVPSRLCAS